MIPSRTFVAALHFGALLWRPLADANVVARRLHRSPFSGEPLAVSCRKRLSLL